MSDYNQNPYGAPQSPPQPPVPPQSPGYGYPNQAQPAPSSYPGQSGYPAQAQSAYPAQSGYPSAPPVQPYPVAGYAGAAQPSNGMGTAGLVCGIIGAVCSLLVFLWFFGLILGILGIIFGAVGRSKVTKGEATNRSAATTGIVLGIVALVLPVLWFAFFASLLGVGAGL
ncbi:DUF4190 domain-containing protein [Streptomyces hiroshimensis]|uniref:DUF4190 domain-containing protein n=1 Tax=Streptomyces hiroshimensis TaxID=66424 RepID=A0ABQ2YEC0_9ACTN|nr:DUF4190 domain-containing protein [Streptomyces hiroshimensis]GGX80421.1 hypothetical protein GCM10010324_27260 [Streptomyces hiroshimensis]